MDSCAGATKGSLTVPTAKEIAMFRSFQYLVHRFKVGISVCCGCASAMILVYKTFLQPKNTFLEIMCC